jgi:hypothetical protein
MNDNATFAEISVKEINMTDKTECVKTARANTEFKMVKTFNTGGFYSEHIATDKKKSDYKMVRNVGIEFARLGQPVKAVPNVHFKSDEYKQIYSALEGTKYHKKCPDLLVGEMFYEVESYIPPFKKDKISGMFSKGLNQSPNIVINNTKGASDRFIKKIMYQRMAIGQDINEVWLYEKGKIRLLYKKQ